MKKSLIIAAFVFSSVSLGMAATTMTVTPNGTANGFYTISGFTMDFNSNANYAINGESITNDELKSSYTDIQLASVEISFANSDPKDVLLTVYEITSTTASSQGDWGIKMVGMSSNTGASGSNQVNTFNFYPIDIDTSKTYAFIYTPNNVNNEGVLSADTLADAATFATYKKRKYGVSTEDGNNLVIGSTTSYTTKVTALATYNLTAISVPEPATASLSLLGLVALMMRRRRA